jgi:hypothetical protein
MNNDIGVAAICLTIVLAMFLFMGEPDVQDALICNLLNKIECY